MAVDLPSLTAPAVDQTGRFSSAWIGFFRGFTSKAPALQPVVVAASPLQFVAPTAGTLFLSGGAGLAAHLTRSRIGVTVSPTTIPVSQGDVVTVSFTTAPTATFSPRVV